MRTAKIIIASVVALAWAILALAQLLSPVAIAILAGLSAGFSVGCVLSIWTYYDPHDNTGHVWAEHNGSAKIWWAVVAVGSVLLWCAIKDQSSLPLAALIAYFIPLMLVGRVRPATPFRTPDPDDKPSQSPTGD